MSKLHFPEPFVHQHKPIRNVNEIVDEKKTPGQQVADFVAKIMGSWPFVIVQSAILVLWGHTMLCL
ncbi:MAG: hypothetical protein LLF92_10075 [Planctomycetaceae bacterium]|nr:hypothetical protein [Planctomycetaceae bacterium]